jgi:hypothetical protein
LIDSEQLHLPRVIDLAFDLVGDRFADAALHLELGGSAVLHADAQADGEFAVIIGGVLRFAPVRGEQVADMVEGLVLERGVVLHGGVLVWVWVDGG